MAALDQSVTFSLWEQARKFVSSGRGALVVRGGAWSVGSYTATQVLRTVSTLILARNFLGPEPFGVVGLVGVFLAGLAMFSELGIQTNVIQHPRGDQPEFLNTAFSIQAMRGAAIWMIAALAAYPLATFYQQPELVSLLVIAGLSEGLRGFTSTAAWTLTREVNLRSVALLTITSEALAAGLSILWAVISPSAWALVARTVVSAGIYALGSHFITKTKVRFAWDRPAAKDILHFGGWISLSTAAYFLGGQGERLILGKLVTPAELGCFSLAVMISSLPSGAMGQLVNQILLPVISKTIRDGAGEYQDFLRARKIFFAVGLVAGVGFLALGKPLVNLLLSPKYEMAGWMLQALGGRVAMDIFAAPASALILAHGQSKYAAAGSTIRLILMAAGLWISFQFFGLHYAVISLLIAQAISYFPMIAGVFHLLPQGARAEVRWYAVFLGLLCLAALVPWPGGTL